MSTISHWKWSDWPGIKVARPDEGLVEIVEVAAFGARINRVAASKSLCFVDSIVFVVVLTKFLERNSIRVVVVDDVDVDCGGRWYGLLRFLLLDLTFGMVIGVGNWLLLLLLFLVNIIIGSGFSLAFGDRSSILAVYRCHTWTDDRHTNTLGLAAQDNNSRNLK